MRVSAWEAPGAALVHGWPKRYYQGQSILTCVNNAA
ncbi:hypothetical protein FHR25_005140 [Yokenella regensburgei]|nr:hypothetical protein FHR25_005140 [Yokenella regensburgei]